jgi:hypothetical protein
MLSKAAKRDLICILRAGFRTDGLGQKCPPFLALNRDGRKCRPRTELIRAGLARRIGGCAMLTERGEMLAAAYLGGEASS